MPLTFEKPADGTLVTTFSGKVLANTYKTKQKQTTGLILLSIKGNPHCQGLHLQTIVEKAFCLHTEVTLLVGDELQWHNLKTGSIDDQEMTLKQQAIAMGDTYLCDNLQYILNAIQDHFPQFDRNSFELRLQHLPTTEAISTLNQIVSDLGTPFKIIRWKDWVTTASTDFANKQHAILAAFDTPESELYTSLEHATNQYIRRKLKDAPEANEETLRRLQAQSRGYLREECAAIIWVGAALGINVMEYPGKLTKLFQVTKKTFVLNEDTDSSNSLNIRVTNRDNLLNEVNIEFKIKKQGLQNANQRPIEPAVAQTPISGSPVSVSGLIQRYESLVNKKKSEGVTPATRHKLSHRGTPRSPTRMSSSAIINCRARLFSSSERNVDRAGAASTDASSKPSVHSFITGLADQIASYSKGLPSEQSNILAKALLAQSYHLLDRAPTPVLNLTS